MTDESHHPTNRSDPDLVLLVAGIIAVVIAGSILLQVTTMMLWILAAVALIGGVTLLITASLRRANSK